MSIERGEQRMIELYFNPEAWFACLGIDNKNISQSVSQSVSHGTSFVCCWRGRGQELLWWGFGEKAS